MTADAREITIKAYAKINLSLDVLGKRENGYHDVSMVLQSIDLHDDVTCRWSPAEAGREPVIRIKVIQDEADEKREAVPEDERNIAYRAAALMMERFPAVKGDTVITIRKRIPAAAGLAGGSTDGAAAVLALYDMLRCIDPAAAEKVTTADLLEAGGKLGADVPFQMMAQMKMNGDLGLAEGPAACTCALAEGTGTELTPVSPLDSYIVLSTPAVAVSTKEVYEGIDRMEISERPDNEALVRALAENDETNVKKNMINVLENYTLSVYDVVYKKKNKMRSVSGDSVVLMSGSGPTVFAAASSSEEADEIFKKMSEEGDSCFLTRTITG